jgi:hypothetical protein
VLYKNKIPWYEWIQELVDVWDPRQREHASLARERLAGLIGAGPAPELVATLGLGAAIVTAACAQRQLRSEADTEKQVGVVRELMSHVIAHSAQKLAAQLEVGVRSMNKLQKLTELEATGAATASRD